MDFAKREHIISRILAGRIRLTNSVYSGIISPKDRLRAENIFKESYEIASANDFFDEDSLRDFLFDNGFWDENDETYLAKLKTELEKLKINGLGKQLKSNELATVRKAIVKVKTEISELEEKKYRFNFLTCTGFAQIEKSKFLLAASLYGSNDKPLIKKYWRADCNLINELMTTYVEERLLEEDIRIIARNEPWRSYWVIGKERDLFGVPVSHFTDEQRSLILWSTFYDNIYGHPERPSDLVIDDNDFLEGWLILEKKKQKTEQTKSKLGFDDGKLKPGDVFVPVGNSEDAAEVNDLNDEISKLQKARRIKVIKERGSVNEIEMPDTKARLMMEANRKLMRKGT